MFSLFVCDWDGRGWCWQMKKLILKDNTKYTELWMMYANLCQPNEILK